MSFQKINKEFCITDNSVNCYGYRLLTEGFQMDRFNPPIGYFMHDRDKGVAVRWSDFRTEGDKVFAKPTINTLQFPDLASQIENGFYQSASVGHIIALEWTDDPAQKLEGQTGITVTKWFSRECSIVDVPGNFNAIAELYDKDDNSLKNLISKPAQSNEENVPDEYRKTFSELFIAGNLEYVEKNYPKYYEKIVADYKAKETHYRPLPGYQPKKPTTDSLQANEAEAPIPEKYAGKTYAELWSSGDLESLKQTHPLYIKALQKERKDEIEKEKNRGIANKNKSIETKKSPSDTSIPEQYRDKNRLELYYNGGLAYLKDHHPKVFNDLMAN